MAQTKFKNWKVVGEKFVLPGGEKMQAGCHHRPGKFGACGGCYARLFVAVEEMGRGGDAKTIAGAVGDAMKAEASR